MATREPSILVRVMVAHLGSLVCVCTRGREKGGGGKRGRRGEESCTYHN